MKKYILYLFCLVGFLSGCEKKDDLITITNPTINSIEPSAGMAGSEVFITGKNFDSDTTKVSIIVDGQKGKIKQISFGKIIAILPTALTPGHKKITLIQSGYTNSDLEFEIYALPQNITIESTTALIGDKVKIVVNDLNPKLTCKITGFINGKEIEAQGGNSSNEFFISIDQVGSVELRMNTIPIKGISLTVYEPIDLLTNHPWTIDKVDFRMSGDNYVKDYEGIPGEFFFNKDGTYSRIERGLNTKGTWEIKRDLNYDKYVITFNEDLLSYQPYGKVEKLTTDSLIFRYSSGNLYKLIPSNKVPKAQPVANAEMADIISRPKLWAIDLNHTLYGDEIRFLPDGTFIYHSLDFFSDLTKKGTWMLENFYLGKITLKISISDNTYEFEVLKAEFDELKLKINGFTGSYIPRYW